jgi:peptidoglycan hydrolase CwlO-like protein
MLFNPTPLERLTTLTTELINKQTTTAEELKALQEEIVSIRAHAKSKDDEIERLTAELAEKDQEIEAIVAKIESLLG